MDISLSPTRVAYTTLDCKPNDVVKDCNLPVEYRFPSVPVGGYCFPKDLEEASTGLQEAFAVIKLQIESTETGSGLFDVYLARKSILFSVGTAFLLFVWYSQMMSYCSEPLAYLVIFLG